MMHTHNTQQAFKSLHRAARVNDFGLYALLVQYLTETLGIHRVYQLSKAITQLRHSRQHDAAPLTLPERLTHFKHHKAVTQWL